VHTFAYSVIYEFEAARVRETAPLRDYRSRARSDTWTEEELVRIRLVLRKLTALRVENPEDAEDLVQETLLTMVRKAPDMDIEKGPLIWAMGILRKKVGNYYRRALRCISLDDRQGFSRDAARGPTAAPSPEASLHYAELCAVVESILQKLSAREREAIDLYLMGTQTAEIVALLHPERYQNIVNRIHRGRKKLVRELARYGYNRRDRNKPR
jgi:RNA polymerase sigma factor (sigma-70 family)